MDAEVRRDIVKSCMEIRTWAMQAIGPGARLNQALDLWAPAALVEAYNRSRASLIAGGMYAPTFDGPAVKILLAPDALDFVNDVDVILQLVS